MWTLGIELMYSLPSSYGKMGGGGGGVAEAYVAPPPPSPQFQYLWLLRYISLEHIQERFYLAHVTRVIKCVWEVGWGWSVVLLAPPTGPLRTHVM